LNVLTIERPRLALALLQLSAVFDQIYLRMAAIFVFSLSLASGVCACVFLAMESELGSSDKANRWVQASMDLTSLASLDFWLCLAWPLTSLTWWVNILDDDWFYDILTWNLYELQGNHNLHHNGVCTCMYRSESEFWPRSTPFPQRFQDWHRHYHRHNHHIGHFCFWPLLSCVQVCAMERCFYIEVTSYFHSHFCHTVLSSPLYFNPEAQKLLTTSLRVHQVFTLFMIVYIRTDNLALPTSGVIIDKQ